MAAKVINKEEAIELKRLYKEHVAAVNRTGVILVSKDAESPEFMEADRVAEAIHRRIRKVLDAPDTGQPEGNEATAVTEAVERGTSGADPREGQLPFPRVYIEARPKVAARALRLMTMSSKTTRIMCSARSRSRTRQSSGQGRTATHRWSRVRHRNDKKRSDLWREA
jgi:hypothetical protein